MSSNESDSLNDESAKLGYDSRSSGTYSFCDFPLRFYKSVVSVIVLRSDIFAPTGVDPKGGLSVVDSLHYFGAQIPDFTSNVQNQFYTSSLNLRSRLLQML